MSRFNRDFFITTIIAIYLIFLRYKFMKRPLTIILLLIFSYNASAQRTRFYNLSDISITASREGTVLGVASKNDKLLLVQNMTLPYSFPDSSYLSMGRGGDHSKMINYMIGMQAGLILRDKPKEQYYSKLRLGVSAGTYKVVNIGGIADLIPYRIDTLVSSTDSSLIYIDSSRANNVLLEQSGINIRLAIDYIIYLKTRSSISGYVGLGTAFKQSFTNNVHADYYGQSAVGSNTYNADAPAWSGNLDIVSAESNYEWKNNSQLNLHMLLGVQAQFNKNDRLSMFVEFQPGLTANYQKELDNRIGTNWLSQVGILYSFKKKEINEPSEI